MIDISQMYDFNPRMMAQAMQQRAAQPQQPINISTAAPDLNRGLAMAQMLQQSRGSNNGTALGALSEALAGALRGYGVSKEAGIKERQRQSLAGALQGTPLADIAPYADPQTLAKALIEMRTKTGEPFTLGEGQIRYDAQGNVLAKGAPKQQLRTVGTDLLDISGDSPQLLYRAPQPQITPYQAASLGMQAQGQELAAQGRSEALQYKKEEEANRKAERGAERYANELEKSGISELKQQIDMVNAVMPSEGDIPGYGYAVSAMPDALVSKQGQQVRQAVAGVRNAILKARSGGAVTDGEATRLLEELGEGSTKSDEQLRMGMQKVQKILDSKIRNIAAGVPKESINIYKERGGNIMPPQQQKQSTTDLNKSYIDKYGLE